MERFKVLKKVIVVFMILISNSVYSQNKHFLSDTIFLYEGVYKIVYMDDYCLHIEIDTTIINKKLYRIESPIFLIKINDKIINAKGILFISSEVPNNCDYFYPLDNNNHVMLSNNKLMLLKVGYIENP